MGLEINSDNTVDGDVVLAFSDEMIEMMSEMGEEDPSEGLSEADDLPDGAKVEEYDQSGYTGQRITFEDASLKEMSTDGLSIVRDGDEFVFSFDAGEEFTEENPMEALAKPRFRLKVTFPGKVAESNGNIDGNTVTWGYSDLKKGGTLTARGSAIDSGMPWPMLGAGLGGLVVVGGAGALLLRGRASRKFSNELTQGWTATPLDAPPMAPAAGVVSRAEASAAAGLSAAPTGGLMGQPLAHMTSASVPLPVSGSALADPGTPVPTPLPVNQPLVEPAQAPVPVQAPVEIPAGWYPTADGLTLRYHDGITWTDHVRPAE